MAEETRLVDIPEYAKVNKKGKYYALKRDMPYYADEKDVRGCLTIGSPSDVPGKMIPDWSYHTYCAPDAYEKKQERIRLKQEEEERARREEEAHEEELEQTLGEEYISLKDAWEDLSCYPLNGYLAEMFFRESGLSPVLDDVFGKEQAFLIKLVTAVMATNRDGFEFDCLNEYPMELHIRYEVDRYLSMRLWDMITDEQKKRVFDAWIRIVNPQKVSALAMKSNVTLYHDDISDGYSDGWFCSRIRTGTKYHHDLMIYRDDISGKLLAVEDLMIRMLNTSFGFNYEAYTVQNSSFKELQGASLHYFLPAYLFKAEDAVKQMKTSVWMHPSEYSDQKEMKKILKTLDEMKPDNGVKILRWQGTFNEVQGNWTLVEIVERREWQTKDARGYLNQQKNRLLEMSYYPACEDYMACYFRIEKEDEEGDFFDNAPFTVRFEPKATEKFRSEAGRYLHFTMEETMDDQALLRNLWYEEDLNFEYSAYINHGETTDVTDNYFSAMRGRELTLFLACVYRAWIYDHVGDLFTEGYDVHQFANELNKWRCDITSEGQINCREMSERISMLISRFGFKQEDVQAYLFNAVQQDKYFSDEFSDTYI